MQLPLLCSTERYISAPINNVFAILLTLFISASATFAATLVVPSGGDLQAAINSAAPGDIIVLDAGGTYRGPYTLPNKSGTSYITITSSRASEITGRVSPSQSSLLAKLRSNVAGDPINNVFAILLTLFISASATFAATLVVPSGGDLQAAINSAAPGD